MGSVLPGQPVPTLSSVLTLLGYSGSCQQAQPAEPFAPCSVVASPPVGAFSQTLFTWHLWLGQGQGLRVVKTLESVHGAVGTGHAGALAWQGFKFSDFPAPAGLCQSPNTVASCITSFFEVSASPCPSSACTSRSEESEKRLQVDVTLAATS